MRPVEVFVAPLGNAFMRDLATWLVEAARLLGRDARLRSDPDALPDDERAVNLVVAPHELYLLGGRSDRAVDRAATISVPVCTEQPGTPWFEISTLYAHRSPLALDINRHGVAALRDAGLDAHHLRLGGVPSMDRRRDAPRRTELLFLGGHTERRGEVLAGLAPILWDRRVDLRLFSFARPVGDGDGGLVFGADKYDLLADSRVLLNLHRDEATPGYFEWARLVEAMANGCCVVTEPSTGAEPLRAGRHYVETDDPLATLPELLDDPRRTAEIGSRAATAVLDEHPLTATLGPELERIDEALPATTRRRLVAPRYRARATRAQQIPLLPAFRPTAAIRRRIFDAMTAETVLQRRIERLRSRVRFGVDDHVEELRSDSFDAADPEVSVVVTLFGYAHLVVETLDSIAASRDVELEIVVVDDHSTDGGRDVVRRWLRERRDVPTLLLGSDVNRGLPAARNLGIGRARAGLVMVMDADNLVYPTALRRLADALEADPGAAFAYSMLEEFGTSAGVRSAMGWHVPWLCERNYIDAQAMLRRDAWERHGGYADDPSLFGWEDWELWLRLAAAGERGAHVAQLLGRYRTQPESMLSTSNLVGDHMHALLRDRYPELPWPMPT